MNAEISAAPAPITTSTRPAQRSEQLLEVLRPYRSVALVSHVNPDPDALASMLGLEALLRHDRPDRPVTLTVDGMIARAENQAMVELLELDLVPVERVPMGPEVAVVMVDTQPHTGRRADESARPTAVLDHHETPGSLDGVLFRDIRPHVGATSTIVTGYLLERGLAVSRRLATALLYGIESEASGYPRESSPADDGALVWLFPRADKDLLARIKNPRLPRSYFAVFQHALANAFLYPNVIVSWCGEVPQPDLISELADFFIRFDQVDWALTLGVFEGALKLSLRSDHLGGHCGELLREVVDGLGTAGGHDRRAGGAIPLRGADPLDVEDLLTKIRGRFLAELEIDEPGGRRLLDECPVIPVP